MRAVAAALVLIVGAAVVLWYGNTLNSWVLGGLIGGLAALLLSIPISLTIFSFLSRRHDERLRANEDVYDEEYDPRHEYLEVPQQVVRSMYVVAEDRPRSRREVWGEEEEWDEGDEEEDFYRRTDAVRRTQEPPRLPAPGQQKPVPRLPAPQRGPLNSKQLPASTRPLPERSTLNTRQLSAREREITSRRPTPQRMNQAGFPGYQAEVPRSQLRSQALRTARLEAARQREEDEIEELPSYRPRRFPTGRSGKALSEQQNDEQSVPRSKQYPRRPRYILDASPTQHGVPPVLPQADKIVTHQSSRRQQTEPETEYIDSARPDGDLKPKGDLKRSLVRRAPYMYEDDPLRKQLSQQVDGPITRRSSRNLATPQDEK